MQVSSGVPKGSVLGPILLLFYINDLPDSLQSQFRLYADDTAEYLAVQGQAGSKIFKRFLMYFRNGKRSETWN